jgi:antitoxin component YwqK of YwqJK toxin-antitoxin module
MILHHPFFKRAGIKDRVRNFVMIIQLAILVLHAERSYSQWHYKYETDTIKSHDTLNGNDTVVYKKYKHHRKLEWADYYVKDSLVFYKMFFYYKHTFSVVKCDNPKAKPRLTEVFEYYPDSHLKSYEFRRDWILKLSRTYYHDGTLETEDIYGVGDMDTGMMREYHSNGKIWTEWMFVGKKLMEVNYSRNRNGDFVDKGSLSDGNGTVYIYNEEGKLIRVLFFKNGKMVRSKKIRMEKNTEAIKQMP